MTVIGFYRRAMRKFGFWSTEDEIYRDLYGWSAWRQKEVVEIKKDKNMHRIEIKKSDDSDEISLGKNTKVLIDGVEIKGISNLYLTLSPQEFAVLRLEISGDISVDIGAQVEIHREETMTILNRMGQKVGEIKI